MASFLLGFLFGVLLSSAKLNRFDTISGMATLENFKVAKAIALAIGVGILLINAEIGLGLASYHVKPLMLGGIVVGGLIFGIGMAILGYCPGTLMVSVGEGSLDAVTGLFGGLAGGLAYTLLLPSVSPLLGPNLGAGSLFTLTGSSPLLFYTLVVLLGLLFSGAAFFIHRADKSSDKSWILAGTGIALLNGFVFYYADRQIGASTFFPYVADQLLGVVDNDYFRQIAKPGAWEVPFWLGGLVAGTVLSLFRKEFKLKMIHDNWRRYKGDHIGKRMLWAFVGGFILIFGARMAGGCTSGHVISGGMQVAFSSLTFALFVFAGLLLTGKVFYRSK
ncbi:MAG: YeeE/YedE family protein [Marinilabiliales bacterium]|nr:YeeE/YedE family protein [Marinilabiliales bacterium]